MAQRDPRIRDWVGFFQRHWPRIRNYAARRYREDGRGSFLVDLDTPPDDAALENGNVNYRSKKECEDDDERALLGEMLDYYNPAREISLVCYEISENDTRIASLVLEEYPDGTPTPMADERRDRWCGHERPCPDCGKVFISLHDYGTCPQCGRQFHASREEYRARNSTPIEPIGRYEPPAQAPADYEELSERVRELRIRDGREGLGPTERLISLAEEMYFEVHNGGFKQYFGNSSGNHAADLLDLLTTIGDFPMRSILTAACAPFPDGRPSPDSSTRWEQYKQFDEATCHQLEMLSSKFYRAYPEYDDFCNELWKRLHERFPAGS
jgi:hypothetical protein